MTLHGSTEERNAKICNQTKNHTHLNLLLGRDCEYFGQANLIAWERGKITAEESLGFEVRAPLLQPQPVGSAQKHLEGSVVLFTNALQPAKAGGYYVNDSEGQLAQPFCAKFNQGASDSDA